MGITVQISTGIIKIMRQNDCDILYMDITVILPPQVISSPADEVPEHVKNRYQFFLLCAIFLRVEASRIFLRMRRCFGVISSSSSVSMNSSACSRLMILGGTR